MATIANVQPDLREDLVIDPFPSLKVLATAYLMLDREQVKLPDGPSMSLLETVYYEWTPDIDEFLKLHKAPDNLTFAAFRKSLTSDSLDLVGLSFFNRITRMGGGYNKAEVGFAFFAGGSIFEKLILGRKMIDWVFANRDIHLLFGTTPEQNIPALVYARRLGFTQSAKIPNFATWRGALTDAWISSLTREDWRGRNGRSV